jgi:putative resolvase
MGPITIARVVHGATGLGLPVEELMTEIRAGLNGHRRELRRALSGPTASALIVEQRDRLTRFGVEHHATRAVAVGTEAARQVSP